MCSFHRPNHRAGRSLSYCGYNKNWRRMAALQISQLRVGGRCWRGHMYVDVELVMCSPCMTSGRIEDPWPSHKSERVVACRYSRHALRCLSWASVWLPWRNTSMMYVSFSRGLLFGVAPGMLILQWAAVRNLRISVKMPGSRCGRWTCGSSSMGCENPLVSWCIINVLKYMRPKVSLRRRWPMTCSI